MICDVLEKDFSFFFSNYTTKHQSDNFINFDNLEYKSKIQIKLNNGIVMPHEAIDTDFDEKVYIDKYLRRIERFKKVIKDEKFKKIFIRTDEKKLIDSNKQKLIDALNVYGCVNYEIKFITYSDYICKENFTWQRNYIDWKSIFLFQ